MMYIYFTIQSSFLVGRQHVGRPSIYITGGFVWYPRSWS